MGFLFSGPKSPVSCPYPYNSHMSYMHAPYQHNTNTYHPSEQYSFPFPYRYNLNQSYYTNPLSYQDSYPTMSVLPQTNQTYLYEPQYHWSHSPYAQHFHSSQFRNHSLYDHQPASSYYRADPPPPNNGIL